MIQTNLHNHTFRCHHATGTDREYIEAAIRNGVRVLGFSDHTPQIFGTDYVSGMTDSFAKRLYQELRGID